jgi:hypothetical protein
MGTPTLLSHRPDPKKVGWPVRRLKDMKVEGGKRVWLVAWEGADADGAAWADSWEPSALVSDELIKNYLRDAGERKRRVIEIDTRPLDGLVQKRIGRAALAESTDSFGHLIVTELPEMRLADIAWNYFDAQKARFPEAEVGAHPASRFISLTYPSCR